MIFISRHDVARRLVGVRTRNTAVPRPDRGLTW